MYFLNFCKNCLRFKTIVGTYGLKSVRQELFNTFTYLIANTRWILQLHPAPAFILSTAKRCLKSGPLWRFFVNFKSRDFRLACTTFLGDLWNLWLCYPFALNVPRGCFFSAPVGRFVRWGRESRFWLAASMCTERSVSAFKVKFSKERGMLRAAHNRIGS